jgi:diacylglycerol O-acyltransferase
VLRGPRQVLRGAGATSKVVGAGLSAPHTVFNVEIGPHRRFAITQTDLADLKRVKDAHGGTVNDVILSVVAGAIGKYLRARGHDTEGLEMRALVPVSVRAAEEHGALGNRITAMMAPLPVWAEDPVERLHIVTEQMGDLKSSGQAVGAEILTKVTDFAPTTIASQAARLQPAQRFFNLVVTNVPGPQFPLYVLGRKMESIFPMVPLARRQALCVGIMSYNGQVNFGLVGDYDAMADLDSFALDLEATTAELIATAPKAKKKAKASSAASNGSGTLAARSKG